jgi:outer membrane receptor protein involved in Fe transport
MPGGLITRCTVPGAPAGAVCPLKGIYFGPGGVPLTFNYGTLSSGNLMTGGDWQISRIDDGVDYDPQIERQNAYARASYDIADNVTIHGELQYGRSHSVNTNNINRLLDQVTILSGNPFIPASIQAQMTALKLTSIIMGSTNGDVGRFVADNVRQLRRWSVGADGKFDAFGTTWTWDAYWQTTMEGLSSRIRNSGMISHIANATDAVRAANGSIICRSTLTNPNDGCVPYNFFGQGVNSQAAINYFVGVSFRYDTLRQHVGSVTLNGEPFSTWAGPVSLATGIEHRQESARTVNTPDDEISNFLAGDFKRTIGQFDVNEGFVETVIPLAKETVWAKSLDMSAAARFTGYTTSGYVTTWKVGANWQFIDDIRVRATRSRDIRAAYLGELYSGGDQAGANTFQDPFTGTATANGYSIGKGNPTLAPEKADTTGVGVVLSPQFFPGFNFSADYYNIDIAGAVAQPNAQGMINACFAGNTALCVNITRQGTPIGNTGLAPIYSVTVSPQNVAQQIVRGIDFESSYRLHMSTVVDSWDGDLSLRALMNYVLHVSTYDPTLAANQYVDGRGVIGGFGVPGFSGLTSPRYRITASARYTTDTIGVGLTMRYVASGIYNNALTECSSGCPNSINTINNNHIDSNTVYDLSLSYKPFHDAATDTEFFLSIQNLFNQAPPFIAGGNSGSYYSGQNIRSYDVVGRFFTAGVRFKM